MSRTVYIAFAAALTCACGGTNDPRNAGAADSGSQSDRQSSAANREASSASPSSAEASSTASAQMVTLSGCLTGGEAATATGTSGRAAGPPTRGAADADSGSRAGRFMLTRAKPTAPDANAGIPASGTGVGANGAGGSGGPLVSGVSDYSLEGNAAELRDHVNQQVRITGRLDPQQTIADAARTGNTPAPEAPAASSGSSGSGVGSPGSSPAARSGGAAAGTAPALPAGRRVVVESVQMVAPACAQQ